MEFKLIETSLSDELSNILVSGDIVAVQSDSLKVDEFDRLQKQLKEIELVKEGSKLTSLFSIKESDSIDSIRRAAEIADKSLDALKGELKYGLSEIEVAHRLEELCFQNGSEAPSFETIVLFGENSALPHGVPSQRALKKGDTILIDFGCTINGFCSDMTRTFFAGEVHPEMEKIYKIVLSAQKRGVDAVKDGVASSYVDSVTRSIIDSSGYGELFGHGTGHGVGLRIHEIPALNKRDKTILGSGMVVTVEPGVYKPHLGGVRVEDLVLVTQNGVELLSKSGKELTILDL
jgi:Xaa-Pro aminopeptidase